MSTEVIKERVRAYIESADDTALERLFHFIEEEDGDCSFWTALPENVKTEIDAALAELDAGKGIPHEEIVKKYPRLCLK